MKNFNSLSFYSLKNFIHCCIYFFIVFLKSLILKNKRFIPLSLPFFYLQIFFDKENKKLIKVTTSEYADWEIIIQIFYDECYNLKRFKKIYKIKKFYNEILRYKKTPLIIDLGAHTGLAAKYFSLTYLESKLVCVEPNLTNFKKLISNNLDGKKNDRIIFKNCAIGSTKSRGFIYNPNKNNKNSAFKIKKNAKGNIKIISINSILKKFNHRKFTPFILKIDIEGFEKDLFSRNLAWINKFPILIIELHDSTHEGTSNSNNFLSAISKRNRDFLYSGENIFSISNKF